MRARFLLAVILICLPTVQLLGQSDSVRPPKANCFRPQPASACRAYFVFELTVAARLAGTVRPHEGSTPPGTYRDLREFLAFDVGRMVNRPDGHALGWSLEAGGHENGGTRFALKARRRDWHAYGFSTDLAIGPLLAQQQSALPNRGVVQGFGLTGETALGNRGLASVVLSGDAIRVEGRTAAALHAGARLESFPALGGAAIIGIGVIALIVALAHLDYN
jgi:hypothetical protein